MPRLKEGVKKVKAETTIIKVESDIRDMTGAVVTSEDIKKLFNALCTEDIGEKSLKVLFPSLTTEQLLQAKFFCSHLRA